MKDPAMKTHATAEGSVGNTVTTVSSHEYDVYNRVLDDDGFCVWPKLIPSDLIDTHLEGLEQCMRASTGFESSRGAPISREVFEALKRERAKYHREHEPTLSPIFNQELIDCLARRFDHTPLIRQPQTGFYQQHTPAHTEH